MPVPNDYNKVEEKDQEAENMRIARNWLLAQTKATRAIVQVLVDEAYTRGFNQGADTQQLEDSELPF